MIIKKISSLPPDLRTALLEGIAALCRIFWGPDDASCEAMLTGDLFRPFGVLAPSVDTTPPDTLDRIRFETTRFSSCSTLNQNLEEAYVRLFISSRQGITAPLYQSCYEYENAPLMGPPAEEMKNRFLSKGLSLAENFHEPPDHISLELEYLYFLLESGWTLKDEDLLAEAASFAAAMIPWIIQFRDKLEGETRGHFYWMAVSLLIALLEFVAPGENGV